jgi:hypothetical protein
VCNELYTLLLEVFLLLVRSCRCSMSSLVAPTAGLTAKLFGTLEELHVVQSVSDSNYSPLPQILRLSSNFLASNPSIRPPTRPRPYPCTC